MLSDDSVNMWLDQNVPHWKFPVNDIGSKMYCLVRGLLTEIVTLQSRVDTLERSKQDRPCV